MDVKLNRRFLSEVHNHPDTERVLVQAALPIAAKVAAATPTDSGFTASSTHVEGGHRSADGRSVAAWVVQSGAGVQQQFGNSVERTPARQFDRGLGL
ncbi:hypothetical protein GCM10023201_40960 [Actinomycetospora corticicola]|uniref:HK97 gp10 family phage protein n=1 Tax=Actinomycetospora corticicola TaxID=663602 RepID=A0A7Y9J6V6_9PSEU|nr:hypothetical protein [Actinomycetospora corticicola]NYD36819.1 hypothetical protein [Actinomycetospora corticicola]